MAKVSRTALQAVWALATNSYIKGFVQGGIYQGSIKSVCVPGLNCYSCPGALGACPIGAMQAVSGSRSLYAPLYALGFIAAYGALLGRAVCGWLCPFGLVQDLVYKIPAPRRLKVGALRGKGQRVDNVLRKLKYILLIVFVLLLPALATDVTGLGSPWFCKYICPAGTLLGGWPLTSLNAYLRAMTGALFTWKSMLLVAVLLGSVFIYRPFCKYMCPLGAMYSLFNKISFLKIEFIAHNCTGCGKCEKVCKMGVNPPVDPNHMECIRCGDCIKSCPEGALNYSTPMGASRKEKTLGE